MSIKHIETGLPPLGQPFSWAVQGHQTLYTAHGPVDAQGRIAGDTIEEQARLTLRNLETSVHAAGATLRDVAQVLIYLRDAADIPRVDAVYREFFQAPYPNRSCVGGLQFAHPAMAIELVAYVAVG